MWRQQQTDQAAKVSAESFKLFFMLENANPCPFLTLFTDLRKDMIKKHDNLPHMVVETFDMLNRWRPEGNGKTSCTNNQQQRRQIGHTYVQAAGPPNGTELVPGRDGTTSNVLCYRCQNWGHISPNCPNACSCSGHSLMQYGICLMQRLDKHGISSNVTINAA